MGPPATATTEGPARRTTLLLQRLRQTSAGRGEFSARLALACALTTLVAVTYQTPDPALTTYVAFFLNRRDRTTSVMLGAAMIVVITLVVAIILLVAQAVADRPALRVASMAAISLGLLFLVSASKLRPIGGTMALIIAYGLDLLGSTPAGELATRGLLYAWLFIGIPAGVSIVVNLIIGPSPRELVQHEMALRLRLAADMLVDPCERTRAAFALLLRQGDAELRVWLQRAAMERISPAKDIAALRACVDSTVPLLSAVAFSVHAPGASVPTSRAASLSRTLARMADIFAAGGYPARIGLDPAGREPPTAASAQAVAAIRQALAHFSEPPADTATAKTEKAHGGFLRPDAFSNPGHARYALKTTAAAMICYLIYSQLAWPTIHTALITCYIVSLGTLAESVEKLSLRIAGCLIGAALGLAAMIWAVPSVTSATGLLVIVFLGALTSAWVVGGGPRIAYAGFQMAFAFFLCVIQGSGPSFNMVTARDRVLGILLGIGVSYAVSRLAWPVSIEERIDRGLAVVLQAFRRMLQASLPTSRRQLAAEARTAISAVRDDLELARYEPAALRPSADVLARHGRLADDAAALLDPLLLMAELGEPGLTQLSERVERLSHPTPPAPQPASPVGDPSPLRALVEVHMHRLEAALGSDGDPREAPHGA